MASSEGYLEFILDQLPEPGKRRRKGSGAE